jgi:DNA-binding IclR family transcriptional regulator
LPPVVLALQQSHQPRLEDTMHSARGMIPEHTIYLQMHACYLGTRHLTQAGSHTKRKLTKLHCQTITVCHSCRRNRTHAVMGDWQRRDTTHHVSSWC